MCTSGFFCGGLDRLGGCGRWGGGGDWCSLGSNVVCYGTVRVLRFFLNRPRVGGCHGVCVNFSLLTAPGPFVSKPTTV